MIRQLFGRAARQNPEIEARVPEGTVVYAVGDIHGRADLLGEMLALIAGDGTGKTARRRVIVFLGDYVDRGSRSRDVIDRLLEGPPPGFEAVHLLGNHEACLLDFLEDVAIGPGWLQFGGDATMMSYGLRPNPFDWRRESLVKLQADFRHSLPDSHLRFLRRLALRHVEGDYEFVHAGVRPGVPLEAQNAEDLLWIREPFLSCDKPLGRIVVHGHTISPEPEIRVHRIGIDTGAFATGRLTCLVLEGASRRFLST